MTRIYISSTYEDLREYREAVERALRKLRKEVVAMEDYVATDRRPLDKCLADVDACDIYVGIFALRYGYVPEKENPDGRSITELEYRHAFANGKACLVFLLDNKASWPTDRIDGVTGDGNRGRRIEALRQYLEKETTVSYFHTADELAREVSTAVELWEEPQRAASAGAEPGQGTSGPVESRLAQLNITIKKAQAELDRCERGLIFEDDPEKRTDYRSRVSRLRPFWTELWAQYVSLEASIREKVPGTENAAMALRHMKKTLEAISRPERQPGIGLALSGGGFRATLYHLGSLWRLNEFGLLRGLSEISSVSAGSILAGIVGLRWNTLRFNPKEVAVNFEEAIGQPVRKLCSTTIDRPSIVSGLLSRRGAGDFLVDAFDHHVFGGSTLQDLPDEPRITIYATSFQTGAAVRFSKPYLADYHLGLVRNPAVPLAQAVGASCAVPPFLGPVTLRIDPDAWEQTEGADLFSDEHFRSRVSLADGGLYDDMALERVWDRYQTVLVSDAGMPFEGHSKARFVLAERVARALEIVSLSSRNLRKRKLMEDFRNNEMDGAYWGIGVRIADYGTAEPGPMTSDSEVTRLLSKLRTRFARFSAEEQARLINWGYASTDAAVRRLVRPPVDSSASWPMPDYPL